MKQLSTTSAIVLCLTLAQGLVGCAKDTTPPDSPSNLVKTTRDNDNTPTYTWDAVNDEGSGGDHYLARVDDGDWSDIGNVTTYTCTLSDGSHAFA